MNLFSRQVRLNVINGWGREKSSHRWICRDLYNNVLHGCLFDTKHVPKGVDNRNHSLIKTFSKIT